jgi:hypothetical protein
MPGPHVRVVFIPGLETPRSTAVPPSVRSTPRSKPCPLLHARPSINSPRTTRLSSLPFPSHSPPGCCEFSRRRPADAATSDHRFWCHQRFLCLPADLATFTTSWRTSWCPRFALLCSRLTSRSSPEAPCRPDDLQPRLISSPGQEPWQRPSPRDRHDLLHTIVDMPSPRSHQGPPEINHLAVSPATSKKP